MPTLGIDEKIIMEKSFNSDVALFWIKSNYILTNKRITGNVPNKIIFRLIPIGKNEISFPLKNIASVNVSSKFEFGRIIDGLILFFVGLILSAIIIGIPILIIGFLDIISPYHTSFAIVNNAGQIAEYKISNLQKNKAKKFAGEINKAIADIL